MLHLPPSRALIAVALVALAAGCSRTTGEPAATAADTDGFSAPTAITAAANAAARAESGRDDPESLADAQRGLEKLLSERAGGQAVDRLAAEYTKTTGKEARRANPVGAERSGGDRAFYEALSNS